MQQIFVVSDGTGQTATQSLAAALTQFATADVNLRLRAGVREESQVSSIVAEAASEEGFIVHTLVTQSLRHFMVKQARLHNVETIDLMGPLLARLSHRLANSPSERPGLFQNLDDAYFRTLAAADFAIRHDDGLRPHELNKAEIVLAGVSRTFKTPLSIYLAFKGWYVANVPMVLNLQPPRQLLDLPPSRVFGLTMSATRMVALRRSRHAHLKKATGDYAQEEYIQRELRYARTIFSRSGWRTVDVTNKPIEEIASELLALRH